MEEKNNSNILLNKIEKITIYSRNPRLIYHHGLFNSFVPRSNLPFASGHTSASRIERFTALLQKRFGKSGALPPSGGAVDSEVGLELPT